MDEKLISYLLGELPEDEESQLEENYLWDKEKREQLSLAEDELIYAYARGELAKAQREQFESYFLNSPKRQDRLRMAKTVVNYTAQLISEKKAPVSPSWWQKLLELFSAHRYGALQFAGAAIIIMLVSSLWLAFQVKELKTEVSRLEANQQISKPDDRERQRADMLARQLEQEKNTRSQLESELAKRPIKSDDSHHEIATAIPVFDLSSIFVRGGAQELAITRTASFVELHLALSGEDVFNRFGAQLLKEGSEEVWRQTELKPKKNGAARYVSIKLPTELLDNNDYLIRLAGINSRGELEQEEFASYTFRVSKR